MILGLISLAFLKRGRNRILSTNIDLEFINGGETYLITGANGFIGQAITMFLLKLNKEVLALPCKMILAVRNYEKAVKEMGNILNDPNVILIKCDNKDGIIIPNKVDWIIHTAAITKKNFFSDFPADTMVDNIAGVYHCLEYAKEKQIKGMIFISSVQVYGQLDLDMIAEDNFGKLSSMSEISCYPESKRCGEMLCWSYAKQYHVPVKCVRLFHVYGEGEQDNGTFLSDFLKDIKAERDIIVLGTGEEVRNLCYITDAVRGIFYVLHKGLSGEAYNVGSEINNLAIKEIAELLCKLAAENQLELNMTIKGKNNIKTNLVDKQVPDLTKVKELGWNENKIDLEDNFRKIIREILQGHNCNSDLCKE